MAKHGRTRTAFLNSDDKLNRRVATEYVSDGALG